MLKGVKGDFVDVGGGTKWYTSCGGLVGGGCCRSADWVPLQFGAKLGADRSPMEAANGEAQCLSG